MTEQQNGKLIIISGPSGAGKSTVVSQLIDTCPLPLRLSISATTRPVRADDEPDKNYIFLSDVAFQERVKTGDFLEYVEVFGRGYLYGTLQQPVTTGLNEGYWIILEIDVEGAQKVKEIYTEAVSIFIHPGSLAELERRLRGRATDDEKNIQRRLEVASHEFEASVLYDHIVTNSTIEQTVDDICQLLLELSDPQLNKK